MSYLLDLHRAHLQRRQRLSVRAPEAGPLVEKPRPRTILFDKKGKRIAVAMPPPLPPPELKYPPIPPLPSDAMNSISIGRIMFVVAQAYNTNIAGLKSHRRMANIVRPRQVAMYLAREMVGGSYPMIGRLFGGFDHTTVMHAVAKIPDQMQIDIQLAAKVQEITQKIHQHLAVMLK